MTEHLVIARYDTTGVHAGEVRELLRLLSLKSRAEPGNLQYDVAEDVAVSGRFFIIERYRTVEDFADHRDTEHFVKIARRQIIPLLVARDVVEWTAVTA